MNKTKYYQLQERSSEASSIGVVKAQFDLDTNADLEMIKRAIEAHFDEEITSINITKSCTWGNHEISFDFVSNDRETEIIDAVETWLYF